MMATGWKQRRRRGLKKTPRAILGSLARQLITLTVISPAHRHNLRSRTLVVNPTTSSIPRSLTRWQWSICSETYRHPQFIRFLSPSLLCIINQSIPSSYVRADGVWRCALLTL